jgi:electron transfer flavoprotein beta subunit
MNIVVTVKLVPDLVEELVINASGTALDMTATRLKLNECDDHAIEQAVLLQERGAGQVTIIAPDVEGVDDALYTAAAKGTVRLIKLTRRWDSASNHALARVFANAVEVLQLRPELILTGVQAHNDLDGTVGPILAEHLGMPYVGYVSSVKISGSDQVTVRKEYPGGLLAEMQVTLPAVLGIQAADKPPRYVPISKIRQTMKTATIETFPAAELEPGGAVAVSRMFQPEIGARATMLEGDADQVGARLIEIFKEQSVL